jgi:hypothetical protein
MHDPFDLIIYGLICLAVFLGGLAICMWFIDFINP